MDAKFVDPLVSPAPPTKPNLVLPGTCATPRRAGAADEVRYRPQEGRAHPGRGNPYLKAALGQVVSGGAKTDTFLGGRYRRLIKPMPKPKALATIERSILVIIFHMLADPTVEFTELGA
jgi:hypothetical protein